MAAGNWIVERKIKRKAMKILHRHIRNTVIAMTAMVILVIAGIEMFVGFLGELDNIGKNGYGLNQAFVFVLSSLPGDIYPLFPAAALLGCLIGLGRLATNSELIVMQAAGVSKLQIAVSVMRATVLMLVVITILGEGLSPALKYFADKYKANSEGQLATAGEGLWVRNDENFIHIDQASPDGKLHSILRYQFHQRRLHSVSIAREGNYRDGQWIFSGITESVMTDRITTSYIASQVWPMALDPDFVGIANIKPDQASLPELRSYIHYLGKSGLYTKPYEFAFWKRILQPFIALVMIGLAVPFIFGPLRSTTMGFRVLVGVVIGFGFYTLNEFLGPFSLLYQIPPFLSAAVPLLLFAVIDLVLFKIVK